MECLGYWGQTKFSSSRVEYVPQLDTIKIIDNLNIDEAKYLEFDVSAGLKVNSGDWKYNIMAVDENGFKIKMPYEFSVNTKAVDSPNIILADYSIENNFGTNYIPKSEPVELTVRVQNVGQGLTEKIEFNLLENHTYSAIDFTGYLELNEMTPGEFTDINFKIKNNFKNKRCSWNPLKIIKMYRIN